MEEGGRRTFRFVALALAGMLLALPVSAVDLPKASALPGHEARALERPARVVDDRLAGVLDVTGPGETVEVVVQFRDRISPQDRKLLEDLGIRLMSEYRVIPAVHAAGTREALQSLADYPRTLWMEHNQRMELLMNGTTTVMGATAVWNSEILYAGGGSREPIDGTGVTVALVDTGCDAGHPDLDYGSKVIINLKSDFDQSYTEVQDSDTGSGHGTHCAGTILGNGDASAGARRGVAPGARLVSISTGEHFLQNVLGALQWVYEHSRPGNNPYNIRVCSNSWGAGPGEYDPSDSITQVNSKLVLENNVVVVFAAGNSGEDDHDGSHVETSNYGNAPFVLEVAAALHDGGGMAPFSSRGQSDLNHTWPDIAAPGYKIWATEARMTQITAMMKQDPKDRPDAYYMAISGTSMATPHVSGCVALLWQACPSLRVSDVRSEHAGNDTEWWTDPSTRIHEAEYILKLTADYMASTPDNGVPGNSSNGSADFDGRPHDFAQGYGLINASRAVQVCLILEQMRRSDQCATVLEAYRAYKRADGLVVKKEIKRPTGRLYTSWKGEWGYLLDDRSSLTTKHARKVFIPENASSLSIDLNYVPVLGSERAAGELTLAVDSNGDGAIDWRGQSGWSSSGTKHDEVAPSAVGPAGAVWDFYIEGRFLHLPGKDGNPMTNQYREVLVEYTCGIEAVFEGGGEVRVEEVDLHAAYAQWQFGAYDANRSVVMTRYFYDLGRLVPENKPPPAFRSQGPASWMAALLALLAAAVLVIWYARKKGLKVRFRLPRIPLPRRSG